MFKSVFIGFLFFYLAIFKIGIGDTIQFAVFDLVNLFHFSARVEFGVNASKKLAILVIDSFDKLNILSISLISPKGHNGGC